MLASMSDQPNLVSKGKEVEKAENPKIFVACPIGADDSLERQRSDKLLRYVINPVVKDLLGVEPEQVVVRADKMGEPGRITVQVLRELTAKLTLLLVMSPPLIRT